MASTDASAEPTHARTARSGLASDNLERAVLFMMLAAALIPLLNASAKYLAQSYTIVEIAWARYAGHFLYMLIIFAPSRGFGLMRSSRPLMQLARSTLLCVSTFIFFSALSSIPLATATAVSFTAPLMVTALAPFFLGERVGVWRWSAVMAGFIGALIIVRPGAVGQDAAALLVLGSAVCFSIYQILSRKLAAHDPAETSITYIALAGFAITTIPLPFFWKTPETLFDGLVFVGLGVFGGFGHYFMVRAFELAPAPFVSPFNYCQLIGAAVLGFVIFGQVPDLWTWAGAAIVVASGIVILYRERLARRDASDRSPPMMP